MPDSQVLSYLPQSQTNQFQTSNENSPSLSSSSLSYSSSRSASSVNTHSYTENELERMKHCGNLFERRSVVNRYLTNEFFRREPCLYNQLIYKNSARIFHCLKADLNENPILKSLKQQRAKERGESFIDQPNVTEVPKITYDSNQEKRNTLQLAFSTLKFQKVLEDLIEEVQFYGDHPEFKDDQSLVCTILFDYMTRKFQLRDRLSDEPYDNEDQLVTQIETSIYKNKTDLAAELAKNRIKADALTLEELLPNEVREVEHHKAELPLYCWVNPLKINIQDLIRHLTNVEGFKQVDSKRSLEKKCFMVDPHCMNVVMFHYALRSRILNHDLVKQYKLIVQDKSSCLAPHTVLKLLSKKDDVIVTNVSGGLLAAFLGCMMEEYEGKVFVYGATDEDKHIEITNKLQAIGCLKYVRVMREEFQSAKYDENKLENVKVILVNAPCSKSALMNPMEFLFEEGEDVKYLRDYTLDANKPSKIRKCIQEEYALLKHALRFPRVKAVVYQTYSKNSQENEQVVHRATEEFNELRKFPIFPYKITPPVIPLTAEDIQNDEVVKDFKFLQFKPSTKMNGCFIALLTRDRDAKLDFVSRKAEAHHEKKTKQSAPEPATFQEKNFLPVDESTLKKAHQKKISAPELVTSRSKSPKKNAHNKKKITKQSSQMFNNLEEEIKKLQMQHEEQNALERQDTHIKSKIVMASKPATESNAIQSSSSLVFDLDRRSSLDKLAQIGKLDPYRNLIDGLAPKRSSTPTESEEKVKSYQFRSTNSSTTSDTNQQTKTTSDSYFLNETQTPVSPRLTATETTSVNNSDTSSLLFKRNQILNKVKSDLEKSKHIIDRELTSIINLSRKMTETDTKIYLENSILREETVENAKTVSDKTKTIIPKQRAYTESTILLNKSTDMLLNSPRSLTNKQAKRMSKQQLGDKLNTSLNESTEIAAQQAVAMKRIQFVSDSLPALNTSKAKKGIKKLLILSSNGERINNDLFVPRRSLLDYSNYNPLLAMRANRQHELKNLNNDTLNNTNEAISGRRASPPPSTNYTFKEFKLQLLKKRSTPHFFGQSSLTNLQKRYFTNTNNKSTSNMNTRGLENLSFTAQSLSLKEGASTSSSSHKTIKLSSISDTNLNKSFSTKQNTL